MINLKLLSDMNIAEKVLIVFCIIGILLALWTLWHYRN